jgi:hypothetical protein
MNMTVRSALQTWRRTARAGDGRPVKRACYDDLESRDGGI